MKLCYSTWSMPKLSIFEIVPMLARAGFDSVAIAVNPGWSTKLDSLDATKRRHIRDLIDRYGLGLPAIVSHCSMLARDPNEHAENWQWLKGAIDLAAEWAGAEGPPIVNTFAGGEAGEWERDRNLLVDRTGELCQYAASRGVVLGIEPHIEQALETPDRVLWYLEQVNLPNLKLTFDISQLNVLGIPIEESVPALGPYAAFTHVKDERGVIPDFQFLIPGEGVFDYVRYLQAMQVVGYTGHIGVEISLMVQRRPDYDPVAAAEQSCRVLSNAFAESGVSRA